MIYYMMTADGRRIGPVEAEELVSHGLARETLVWRQDFTQWIPASQIPELLALLNSVPPTPPIPPTPPVPPVQGAKTYPQPNSQAAPYNQNTPGNPFGNQPFNQQCAMNNKPDNYMVWSILSTVLCCIPFGIAAIVFSSKVNSLWDQGRYVEAKEAADKAKMWAMISAGCGIFAGIIGFIAGIAGA